MLDTFVPRIAAQGARAMATASGYYLFALIGVVITVPPSGFGMLWPAVGFLIAALLMTNPRNWWACLIGIIPAHIHVVSFFQHVETPLTVSIVQGAGNALRAAAIAYAVRAVEGGRFDSASSRTTQRYIITVAVGLALGNAVVIGALVALGHTPDFWLAWRQWLLAGLFPALTLPPIFLLGRKFNLVGDPASVPNARKELAFVCAALFVLTYIVMGTTVELNWWPVLLLGPLPLLMWAALRLGVGGACLSLIVFAAAIIVRALNDQGPFAVHASMGSVMSLQVFLTAMSLVLILLAALMQERRATEEMLKRSEERMQLVAASTDTGLWQWDNLKRQLWMTDHCRHMFGLSQTEALTPESFLAIVHEDDRPRLRAALRWMLASPDVAANNEFRVIRNGEMRWFVVRTHTEFDRKGRAVRVSGIFRDSTQGAVSRKEARQLTDRLLTLQEEERQAIAQDLHDSTAQHLVAAGLGLGMLRRRVSLNEAAISVMEEIANSIAQATNELRTYTYLLRPAGLDSEGLSAVLKRYIDGFARRTALKAVFKPCAYADRLPLEQQRSLLRVVQECLMNVHRHAGAKSVLVRFKCTRDYLHIIISDDGRGMKLRARHRAGNTGVGIPGMTARIKQLSGRIAFRSSPKGTCVYVAVPAICEPAASTGALDIDIAPMRAVHAAE